RRDGSVSFSCEAHRLRALCTLRFQIIVTRLLIATTNADKVREIRGLLADAPIDLVTLAAWPEVTAPEETGATFEENARAKALYYAGATGELTVAEDSGL